MKPAAYILQPGIIYRVVGGVVGVHGVANDCTTIAWPGDLVIAQRFTSCAAFFGGELRIPEAPGLVDWVNTYRSLRWFQQMREQPVETRIKSLLFRLAQFPEFGLSGRGVLHLRIPRKWLAFMAGCSREAATCAIKSLSASGAIGAEHNRIELIVPVVGVLSAAERRPVAHH